MFYTLTGALNATGLDKMTILRAIEGGTVAAAKDLFGEWQIERAALHRVFPPVAERDSERDAVPDLPASPGESLPIDQIRITVPAASAWDHQIETGGWDDDPRVRVMLATGALLAAFGLGWIGGSGSYHFFAPHKQLTSSSARNLGSEHESICITRPETGRKATLSAPSIRNVVTPAAPRLVRGQESSRGTAQPAASAMNPASSVAQQNTATHGATAVAVQPKIVPRPRAAPTPDTRPTTIPGWTVREVVGGTVVLEGSDGIMKVTRGDTVPGLGRVDSIVRWGNRWIVATSRGLITTQ